MFPYVTVRPGVWVHLHQNPAALAWMLWRRGKPFTSLLTVSFPGNLRLPRTVRRALAAGRIGVRLTRLRLFTRARRSASLLDLPSKGNLALAARIGGWKVFDLGAHRVTVLLSPELPPRVIARHMHRVMATSDLPLAPNVGRIDVDRRTYEEQFTNGYPVANPARDWGLIPGHYLPVVTELLLTSTPVVTDLVAYVDGRIDGVRHSLREAEQNAFVRNSELSGQVLGYAAEIGHRMSAHADAKIVLAISHGDLHGGNICETKRGPYLIDWQNVDVRSAFFDIHTLLFRALRPSRQFRAGQRWVPYGAAAQRMVVTVNELRASVSRYSEDFALAFTGDASADIYRSVFYLEMLAKAADKLVELPSPTAVLDHLDRTVAWIETFTAHERQEDALLEPTRE